MLFTIRNSTPKFKFINKSNFPMWTKLCALNAWLFAMIAVLAGCGGGGMDIGGSVMLAKDLNPAEAAQRAVEMYDANSDGKLDEQELEKSAALKSVVRRIDADKDGSLSPAEIAARIEQLQSQSDLIPLSLQISSKQRPLSGAEVVFEPEPFLADGLQSYKGVTDATGAVSLQGESSSIPGLPLGFYRVKITHASNSINEELGCEVAEDGPMGIRMNISL